MSHEPRRYQFSLAALLLAPVVCAAALRLGPALVLTLLIFGPFVPLWMMAIWVGVVDLLRNSQS